MQPDVVVFLVSQPYVSGRRLKALEAGLAGGLDLPSRLVRLEGTGPGLAATLDALAAERFRTVLVQPVGVPFPESLARWLPGALGHWLARYGGADMRVALAADQVGDDTVIGQIARRAVATARDAKPVAMDEGGADGAGWDEVPVFRHHLLVCTGPRCHFREAGALKGLLAAELANAGIARECLVATTGCLFPCNRGPVVAHYPAGRWYRLAEPADVVRFAAAPALAQPLSIESCESASTFESAPERVVTLNQQATEVMLALGLEGRMAGTAYLDDAIPQRWLAAYESVPVIAERWPSREVVLAQDPDFLFAGFASAFDEKNLGAEAEWQALGIGTYLVAAECRNLHPDDVAMTSEPIFADLEKIGALFGVSERAEALAGDIRARLQAVAGAAPGAGRSAFLFDSGTETAFTAGCCGAPALLLATVGLENIAGDVKGRWADLAWEAVAAADPDVIVLIEAGWSSAEEKTAFLKADPVLSQLTAVREERFVTVPFSETLLGIRFVEGVERLAAALQEM